MQEQKQREERKKDWILFLNEKGIVQEAFVLLEHFDASFVKFRLHEYDETLIMIPTSRILKIKDRRGEVVG